MVDADPVQDEGAGWFVDGEDLDSASWNAATDEVASAEAGLGQGSTASSAEGFQLEESQVDRARVQVQTGDAVEPRPEPSAAGALDYQDEEWADLPEEKAAAFGVEVKAACVGTEIGFRMARPLEDVRVLWNFGDGQFSSDAEPQHIFRAPGTYDITLSVTRVSDCLLYTSPSPRD